jgi:hypothetical protein
VNEFARPKARFSNRVSWREQPCGKDFSTRHCPSASADDVRLANVSDQGADLPRGQSGSVRVDDRGVAKKARYIVVCARSLVFLFGLDEALAHVVHFRRRLSLAHYVSVT